MSDIIQPCNNYTQYNKFNGFNVYKATDNVVSTTESHQIQINDYGRTLNAINYAAIKYLTKKYDFIRSTFIDFRGCWATQLTDDLHVYSITIGNDGYRLNKYSGWTCDPMPFILALDEFMMRFNDDMYIDAIVNADIVLINFIVSFKVKVIDGKTYYYIDNMFMTDNNVKYQYNKNRKGNTVNSNTVNSNTSSVQTVSKQRDIMYNDIYTILTQIPDVLEKDNSVNKALVNRVLYKNTQLEHYLNDANIETGYKLF